MNEVVQYNVTDAAIAEMKSLYMGLVVKDLDDRAGLAAVHKARMVVKGKRCEVEQKRKELKAEALAWSNKVDSEARRITALLVPIESHLEAEENKIAQEKARIKAEAEQKAKDRAQGFVNAFAGVGVSMPFMQAMEMSDADFFARFTAAEVAYNQEQARLAEEKRKAEEKAAAEKKALEEEAAKLAADRAELDRIRAEETKKQADAEAKLRAEREKLEAERKALEIEKAEKEAADQAIALAAEKAEREAREKADAELKAKEEAERQERLRPDKEKILSYADALGAVKLPECAAEESVAIITEAAKRVSAIKKYVIKATKEL